jgi:hypothetical protein
MIDPRLQAMLSKMQSPQTYGTTGGGGMTQAQYQAALQQPTGYWGGASSGGPYPSMGTVSGYGKPMPGKEGASGDWFTSPGIDGTGGAQGGSYVPPSTSGAPPGSAPGATPPQSSFTPYGPYGPGGSNAPNYASFNFGQAFSPFPNMDTQATQAFQQRPYTPPSSYGRFNTGTWPGMGGGWPSQLFGNNSFGNMFGGAGPPMQSGMPPPGPQMGTRPGTTQNIEGIGTAGTGGAPAYGGANPFSPGASLSPQQLQMMYRAQAGDTAAAGGFTANQLNQYGVGGTNYNPAAIAAARSSTPGAQAYAANRQALVAGGATPNAGGLLQLTPQQVQQKFAGMGLVR